MPTNIYNSSNPVVLLDHPNLKNIITNYLAHWLWFVLSVIGMLLCAYLYLSQQQPIYKVKASLLVQDETKANEQSNLLKDFEVESPKKDIENEIEVLLSVPLMSQVVQKLHLNVRYFYKTTFGQQEIYNESPVEVVVQQEKAALYEAPLELIFLTDKTVQLNGKIYPLNRSIETPYGRLMLKAHDQVRNSTSPVIVQVSSLSSAVDEYVSNLKAIPTSKSSSVIVLMLEEAVPAKGEAVLNQLIAVYGEMAILNKDKIAFRTINFIDERLKIIAGELTTVEKGVESYKSTQGITDLSAQAGSFLQTAQQNDALLNQVNIQLSALNDLEKYVGNPSKSENRSSTPALVGLNDPVLLSLINNLTQMELQRDKLARTTSEQNPLLETLDSQIKITKANIIENVGTMKAMLLSSKQQYTAKNSRIEGEIRTIPQKERSLMNITRQQSIKNNLYTYLLQKREEAAVAFASVISDSRVINPAQSSGVPIRPVKSIIYTLFGLLGLLLPIGVLAGRNLLNDRIVRRFDVEEATQIPILGELIHNKNLEPVVITSTSQSIISEQIRTLRANIFHLKNELTDSQVLLFTSSISGEGKSFVSLNVGISLALIDKPTVIIDMDLRIPKLHKIFQLTNTSGVSSFLNGEATLDEILQPLAGYPNCYIISSGPLPTNPSEILNRPSLGLLIEELRKRFDYIIIDTPPVGLVSDAQLIAPYIDATFFLIRHDVTPKNHIRVINKLYEEERFPRLKIILNAIDSNNSYYYSNSYKNNYVYDRR